MKTEEEKREQELLHQKQKAANEEVLLQSKLLPYLTRDELKKYNGVKSDKIHVAVKGIVFDVTNNSDKYGVGKAYYKLVGKDCSKSLGKSSMKDEFLDDRAWDYSGLNDKESKVLDQWYEFFLKRYHVVGLIIDHV